MNFSELLHITIVLFIIMDSLGNVPLFLSVLKPFEPAHQRKIIMREMLIALAVMIFFLFFGRAFFALLKINQCTLQIAGGIILFMIAIKMVFSSEKEDIGKKPPREPLIVPLAIPATAGPGILATITLYGGGLEGSKWVALIAVIIAWLFSLPVLLLSSQLKKVLGINGLIAIERLFGYLVVLIAANTTLKGFVSCFL